MERKFLYDTPYEQDFEVKPFCFTRVFNQISDDRHGEVEVVSQEKRVFEEGYRAGEKAGFEVGLERARKMLERLEHLVVSLETMREETYTRLEDEIITLTVRIAEKIIRWEISKDPSAMKAIISAALEKIKDVDSVLLRIAPTDFAAIQEALPSVTSEKGMNAKIILREDPLVSSGGCILETDHCEIDGRIEKALETIDKALRK